MIQKINEPVDVVTVSRRRLGIVEPIRLRWHGKVFSLTKIALRHEVHNGRVLHHIFSCSDGIHFFRLNYNTESLQWNLEEFDDGTGA